MRRIHHRLAILLLAAILLVKGTVPPGFMIAPSAKTLTVAVCTGHVPSSASIVIPMERDERTPAPAETAENENCAFAGLSKSALGGADFVLLMAAIAFILALSLAPLPQPALARIDRFQPPPIGPPTLV